MDIRKTFLTMRMERHWYRLLRDFVDALFLEVLKLRLDGTVSNVI